MNVNQLSLLNWKNGTKYVILNLQKRINESHGILD